MRLRLWFFLPLFLAACASVSAPGPEYLLHVVRPGDTLYQIALYFNVSVEDLMQANRLTDTEIYPGQRIVYPWPKEARFYERGEASWYGEEFAGKRTASGEIFDPNELTAAHPTLPFNTLVIVRREDTGETVVVRINDRGPYAEGRIIDLSQAAARAIDMETIGVARVSLYVWR